MKSKTTKQIMPHPPTQPTPYHDPITPFAVCIASPNCLVCVRTSTKFHQNPPSSYPFVPFLPNLLLGIGKINGIEERKV